LDGDGPAAGPAMIADDDPPEVAELEAVAEWRLRQVDADPTDAAQSAAAAHQLHALADGLRRLRDSPLLGELHALCGWLGESDNITDFSLRAHELRRRIGVDRQVETAEDYIRLLIELAKQAM
jgi:hypothetical protein